MNEYGYFCERKDTLKEWKEKPNLSMYLCICVYIYIYIYI